MSADISRLACCCARQSSTVCTPPVTSFVAVISSATIDLDYMDGTTRVATGAVRQVNGVWQLFRCPLVLSNGYINTPIVMQSVLGTTFWCGIVQRPNTLDPDYKGFVGVGVPSGQGYFAAGVGRFLNYSEGSPLQPSGGLGDFSASNDFYMQFSIERFRFSVAGSGGTQFHPYYYEFGINCRQGVVPLIMPIVGDGCPNGPWSPGTFSNPATRLRGCVRGKTQVGVANCGVNYPTQSFQIPQNAVGVGYGLTTML